MTYLDVWRSGTFLLYSCLSEPKKRCQDCLMLSAQLFYSPCLQSLAHSLTCCLSRNVPLLHMSRYVIVVLPGLPPCKRQTLGWEGLGTRLRAPTSGFTNRDKEGLDSAVGLPVFPYHAWLCVYHDMPHIPLIHSVGLCEAHMHHMHAYILKHHYLTAVYWNPGVTVLQTTGTPPMLRNIV